ncbi:zinc-ribbon domain containing protein [Occallatibacter savannae]|uniref:zinc-ribbon domain containing protein n=1 Tax=Occallatibacter savannae TaxID=1002691 RepID=UPI000D686F83|nr:zinc-ribbon domain containing protein [Occallatibacter savannae]
MAFIDIKVKCSHCGGEFVFTSGEQHFFNAKGFTHVPKTCRSCRAKRAGGKLRTDNTVICADCGAETAVPFKPSQNRPVYCHACFEKRRSPLGRKLITIPKV